MKKLAFTGFLLLSILVSFSANRYLVSGGTGNWNSTTNWSASSGGSSGASFPVAGDAVIIDTNSHNANVSVNVTSACASVNIDNAYTGTISMDAGLTTTSTVKLGTGMTLTGASAWTMNTSCTITGSGKSFPALTLGGTSQTFTLADTLRVSGLLTLNGTTATTFSGAYDILCGTLTFTTAKTVTLSANITSAGLTTNTLATVLNGSYKLTTGGYTATGAMSGTAQIKLTGGTWSGSSNISNTSLTLDGNITLSGSIAYSTGTIIYASGTITTTGSTLTCGTGTTFNTSGMNLNNVTLSGTSQTHTLQSNLNLTGTLTLSGVTATTFSGAYNIVTGNLTFGTAETVTLSGDMNVTSLTTVSFAITLNGAYNLSTGGLTSTAALTGSFSKIIFNGTGTWSGAATHTKNVDINTSGTLTISGSVTYNTGTIHYIAGTVSDSASTLTCTASTTFNTSGMNWYNVALSGTSQTHTLQSNLNLTGTLTLSGVTATTFSGAYNITTGNLTFGTAEAISIPAGLSVTGLTTVSAAVALNGSLALYTGGITMNAALTGTFTGIVFNSTGTWSGATAITKNLTINTSGTLTVGNTAYSTGTLTYTAGTVNPGTGSITLTASPTLNCSGMTWANVNVTGAVTLAADCNISNALILNTTGTALNGAYSYKVGGNVTHTGGAAISGTSTILMNGKGTASVTNSAGAISCPFTINTTDTITFGTNFRINNCVFTYTSGTIVATGSTFETSGTASTININGPGFKMGTYLTSISQAFGGSYGFTIGTLNCYTAGRTITFAADKTYNITNEISVSGTAASHCVFNSSVSGTKAIVTLNQGAAEDLGFCDATDINSGSGKTILTYKGIRSNTTNWNLVPIVPKTGVFSYN